MAKKARQKTAGARRGAEAETDRIIDAFMHLIAGRSLGSVGLGEIADEAAVSLGELRQHFAGKAEILAAFSQRIDRIVLDGGPGEGDSPRDRVFDVLMRRFDALTPYREGIGSVVRAARRDLCLAACLDRNATRSMRWMLVAADADRPGVLGAVAVKGLVLVNADALRVWLDDDDPGLAQTMAALDRGLARGARAMDYANRLRDRLCSLSGRDRAAAERTAEA